MVVIAICEMIWKGEFACTLQKWHTYHKWKCNQLSVLAECDDLFAMLCSFNSPRMSLSASLEPEPGQNTLSVSSKATFHVTSASKSGKTIKTTKQSVKTKKFAFNFVSSTSDGAEYANYLLFLQKNLGAHDRDFLVAKKARFSFQYIHKHQKYILLSFTVLYWQTVR